MTNEEIMERIFKRSCGLSCEFTDGCVYTSNPPCYKCTLTGKYHKAGEDCTALVDLILQGSERKEE